MVERRLKYEGAEDDVNAVNLTAELERSRRARAALEGLIADPARLGPDFQPVRRLDDDSVVGWKATGRGLSEADLGDTLALLDGARSFGLVERLDWAFRCHAFDVAIAAGVAEDVHLTPEPETFGSLCPPRLAASWSAGRRALRVVAELHDDAFVDPLALDRALDDMRGWGWRFAIADLSGIPGSSAHLALVRPAYVQVSLAAPDRVTTATRQWSAAALESGAALMAVDVDSSAARELAVSLGASVGRGSVFGKPGDLPARQPSRA